MKKTKIVCTIGPSSWDPKVMKKMIEAGMNCARVNGAFADVDEIDKVTKLVRDISNDVSLMMDVKGPEIRLNKFPNPIPLKPNSQIIIGNSDNDEIYPSNYKNLYKVLDVGQRMVVGDGDVEMELVKIEKDQMHCKVILGELLRPGKALNLPGAEFTTSALTQKDIVNLEHSIKRGWDFVSASFVQSAQSAREIKKYLEGSHMKLIAKIEDQLGVDNIDDILSEVDGIMIARGGLGIELGLEKVPMVQRLLIQKCNERGKAVITATQMLESMITNPKPTRAEVNDVATAILLGTDSVMLSGESSAGKYPVEAVDELSRVAYATEPYLEVQKFNEIQLERYEILSAMSNTIAELVKNHKIQKVIILTTEGKTAQFVARHNLNVPVFALTTNTNTIKHLSITKGINAIHYSDKIPSNDKIINTIIEFGLTNKLINKKDNLIIIGRLGNNKIRYPHLFEMIKMPKYLRERELFV
jgi:pyruvate kinase